jgi:two-component system C4-dicarboxylate transport sensor histidine kinase DctB
MIQDSLKVIPDEVRKTIDIRCSPGLEGLPRIRGSRTILSQLLGNLLINAVESIAERYPKRAGGTIEISAALHEEDGREMLRLTVADNGVGMDPGILSRIFEKHFSTKNRGSGTGLHWSGNAASAMSGNYRPKAEEGTGGRDSFWTCPWPKSPR